MVRSPYLLFRLLEIFKLGKRFFASLFLFLLDMTIRGLVHKVFTAHSSSYLPIVEVEVKDLLTSVYLFIISSLHFLRNF